MTLGRWTATALATLAFTAACARARHETAAEYAAFSAEPVVLEFENNNWADVELYIVHDGQTTRFELLSATHTGELTIPRHLQGQDGIFRILVRRVGGRDSFQSEPISTRTGHTVRLTIESDLQRSSVGVW